MVLRFMKLLAGEIRRSVSAFRLLPFQPALEPFDRVIAGEEFRVAH